MPCPECNLVGPCWCENRPVALPVSAPAGSFGTMPEIVAEVRRHGVSLPVEWSDSRVNFGMARYYKGASTHTRLEFSRVLWPHLVPEARRLTIAHECAHGLLSPGTGHSIEWQRLCLSLGGDGKRCASSAEASAAIAAVAKYEGTCPVNSKHKFFLSRKTKSIGHSSCGICTPGRFNAAYLLTWKQNY